MIIRSFSNGFKLEDWTQELKEITPVYTPLSDLGIFPVESVSQTTVTFEKTGNTIGLIGDVLRGGNVLANQDETRELHTYAIPYHKVIDYIVPQDVQGLRAYGSPDQAEKKAEVLFRKMSRLKDSAVATAEYAKFYALTQGKIWSPNRTVHHKSFYEDFGVQRKEVSFDLDVPTTNILAKIEEVIAHIQDNMTGDRYNGVVCLCSPEFFGDLISHQSVQQAYNFYASTQEPLRRRLGGNTTRYREFDHGGCIFREIRDTAANGERFIPSGEAYFIPTNAPDTFVTYVAPANKFGYENTLGEEYYTFTWADQKGEKEEIELEFSHVHLIRRPEAVVKATNKQP